MNKKVQTTTTPLPRREQEALDAVYALGRASVKDVQARLPGEPSYSATRMLLQRLHKRGALIVENDGAKYIYVPKTAPLQAGVAALRRVLGTFFKGSPVSAFSSLLADETLEPAELQELEDMLAAARARQRNSTGEQP